jgi:hypothetical protein
MRFAFVVVLPAVLLALGSPAAAQHGGSPGRHAPGGVGHATPPGAASPYAAMRAREAAGLGAEEVADLRAGRGMGFALPAELNGYPGPMHVLELAGPLGLSAEQRVRVEGLMAAMRAEAVPLGEALVAAERALDAAFRRGAATAGEVDRLTAEAALARGRVRAAHLRAHLHTRDALAAGQRAAYARLRGYAP